MCFYLESTAEIFISYNKKAVKISVVDKIHKNLFRFQFYYQYVTVDNENYYVAKGGFKDLNAVGKV